MRAVLDAIADACRRGHIGATDAELARHLEVKGRPLHTAIVRLVASGLVEDSPRTRAHDGVERVVGAPTRMSALLLDAHAGAQ